MVNSRSFCLNPFGFELLLNQLIFRLQNLLPFTLPFPPIPAFRLNYLISHFQAPLGRPNISNLVPTARLLKHVLSTCFPACIFAKFPSSVHFFAMITYISTLISQISLSETPPNPVFTSLRLESRYIINSLSEFVIYSHASSNSPILSLSFPPCSSVNKFVSQLSFLSHLLSCTPLVTPTETRARSSAGAFTQPCGRAMPGPVNTNQQVNVAESADPVGSAFLSRALNQQTLLAPLFCRGRRYVLLQRLLLM